MKKKKKLVVLSLFDGISCGLQALKRLGLGVQSYYASEIDVDAITIAKKNHKDIIHMGDVCLWKTWNIDWTKVDLILAGSPCQGFSFAGKQLNFKDPRSKLFFEFVAIYKEAKKFNPKVRFLLENVNMKKDFQDIITNTLEVEPLKICSSNFSPQKRRRLYWTNITKEVKTEKNNFFLKDILLENNTDSSLYLNDIQKVRGIEKYKGKTWKSGNKMGNMAFPDNVNRKSKSISSTIIKGARETVHIEDKNGIRILSPIEIERLQTLPDNYTFGLSNNKRYKLLGNGWNVNTISNILQHL